MKRVFLEMEKIKKPNSGLGQFCLHLGNAFTRLPSLNFQPGFFVPRNQQSVFGNEYEYITSSKVYRFFRLQQKFDIWHCLHQESRYLPSHKSTKIIVTIHDLNFLELKKSTLKQKLKLKKIQDLIDQASAVTVISNYTEKIIRMNLHIPDIPVRVIYNGNSLLKFPDASKPLFMPETRFFFSIGIITPKKNFTTLVPVLHHFKDFFLVIAGDKSHKYAEEVYQIAKDHGLEKRLILPGTVSDEEKYWLYQNCTAFLFPSLAEGFGLPVIEAMSLGKPVFLSTSTSLPEIGGKEAFYFNDFKPEAMAEIIHQGLSEITFDRTKSERIKEWADQFSWTRAAEAYQKLYNEL